jgi:putative transposase
MKNRDYKQFGEGAYYHIYNRSNNKEKIFLCKEDFNFFLLKLKQNLFPDKILSRMRSLPSNSFSLVCYCLMPNHYHLLIRQNTDIPTSKLLQRICTSYSMYFNKKYQKSGHVFQAKFKQVTIDTDKYLLWLCAYIHQNPAVAGIVKSPVEYQWSSYGEFIKSDINSDLCQKSIILDQFKNSLEFAKFVDDSYKIIRERKDIEHLLMDNL